MANRDLIHRAAHGLVRGAENSLWTTMYTQEILTKVSHGFVMLVEPCLIDNQGFLTATAPGPAQNVVIEMELQRMIF